MFDRLTIKSQRPRNPGSRLGRSVYGDSTWGPSRWLSLCLCLLLAFGAASTHAAGKRMAMVVGIDNYRNAASLSRARNDAKAMGQALREAGYEVTELLDTDRRAMQRAIRNYARRAEDGDESVFFFAGHGIQAGSENFLLPADVLVRDEGELRDEGVSLNSVIERLAEARVRFSLLIIDACRDNPLPRIAGRTIGSTGGLAAPTAGRGQAIIYSAGTGQQAIDRLSDADVDPNGLFTRVFVKQMRRPGVSVRQVLQDVRAEVDRLAKSVGQEQYPALYDEMRGDFFFFAAKPLSPEVASPASQPTPATATVVTDEEVEREAWNAIKASAQIEDIREFLSRFPKGRFMDAAELRLGQLERSERATQSQPVPLAPVEASGGISAAPAGSQSPSADSSDPVGSSHSSTPDPPTAPVASLGLESASKETAGMPTAPSVSQPFAANANDSAGPPQSSTPADLAPRAVLTPEGSIKVFKRPEVNDIGSNSTPLGPPQSLPLASLTPGPATKTAEAVRSITIGRRELMLWPGHWELSAEETIGVQGYTSFNFIHTMSMRQGVASRLSAISWHDNELRGVVAMTGSPSSELYDVVNWQDDSCRVDERRNVYHDDYVGGFDIPECLMVRSIDAYDSVALQRYVAALALADQVSLVRPDGYYEVIYTKYTAGNFLRIDILMPVKSFKSESAAISWSKKFAQAARPFAEGTLTSFKLPELGKVDTR